MKPAEAVVRDHPWSVRETVLDAGTGEALLAFVPAAGSTAAQLLVLNAASPHPVVRRLAALGLALLPAGTFAVVALAVDGGRRRGALAGRPDLVDGAVLLGVAAAASALVYGPLVGLDSVRGPALSALAVAGFLVVPFWLGDRALPAADAVEAGVLTVLVSLFVLLEGAVVAGVARPVGPAESALLVVAGVVGPVAVVAAVARRARDPG